MDTAIWRSVDDNMRCGKTGVLLLADNRDAFAARALSAQSASRSLDLMYYLWHADGTGRKLLDEVMRAAERGVRVRMLLDDINPGHGGPDFVQLNQHPNIEIRLFNPTWIRRSNALRTIELGLRRFAMTRRMHNKAWIVDDKIAIVGGRNVGDAYFDAAETNFRDLDLLLAGAAALEAKQVFEAFWNFRAAKPLNGLAPSAAAARDVTSEPCVHPDIAELEEAVQCRQSIAELIAVRPDVVWTQSARLLSDPPDKALGRKNRNWLMRNLLPIILETQRSLQISSPYFIPGREGTAILGALVCHGAEVMVLTNSLAATDVAAVHGAYANYRRRLLRRGIQIYELQPYRGRASISMLGSKGASLHTKAFIVDDRFGFVGSLNFDPRSASLNTEMGVLFDDPLLIAELKKVFERERQPDVSYRVTLRRGRLQWIGERDGMPQDYRRDPEASFGRRLLAAIVGRLPIESEL